MAPVKDEKINGVRKPQAAAAKKSKAQPLVSIKTFPSPSEKNNIKEKGVQDSPFEKSEVRLCNSPVLATSVYKKIICTIVHLYIHSSSPTYAACRASKASLVPHTLSCP